MSDADQTAFFEKIQQEADNSCDWLRDNRMCVAGQKTKLMIVGTKELKNIKVGDREHSIMVDGQLVEETRSEKLLGVIMNSKMTWKEHLHGEKWRAENNSPGLIPQLSQRLGLLKKLARVASKSSATPGGLTNTEMGRQDLQAILRKTTEDFKSSRTRWPD